MSKRVLAILLLFVVMFAAFTPAVYATDGGRDMWEDFNVGVDSEGNLSVDSPRVDGEEGGAWAHLLGKYKNFIVGVTSIATVSMVLFFIWQATNLAAKANNPNERSRAISGLIFTGIGAALLGAASLIIGIFYNAI